MYDFLLNMWKLNKLTLAQLDTLVLKGKITQFEANEIAAMPRSI